MTLTGALVTHYHPDHCGGSMMGMQIEGVTELLELHQMPVHVQADEAEWVTKVTDLTAADLTTHASGDSVMVGEIPIQLLHTPGHTPGSQCFYVNGAWSRATRSSWTAADGPTCPAATPRRCTTASPRPWRRCPTTPCSSPATCTPQAPAERLGDTRARNVVFRPGSVEQWMMMFG